MCEPSQCILLEQVLLSALQKEIRRQMELEEVWESVSGSTKREVPCEEDKLQNLKKPWMLWEKNRSHFMRNMENGNLKGRIYRVQRGIAEKGRFYKK